MSAIRPRKESMSGETVKLSPRVSPVLRSSVKQTFSATISSGKLEIIVSNSTVSKAADLISLSLAPHRLNELFSACPEHRPGTLDEIKRPSWTCVAIGNPTDPLHCPHQSIDNEYGHADRRSRAAR